MQCPQRPEESVLDHVALGLQLVVNYPMMVLRTKLEFF